MRGGRGTKGGGGGDTEPGGLRVVEEKLWKALVKAFILGGDEGEKAR